MIKWISNDVQEEINNTFKEIDAQHKIGWKNKELKKLSKRFMMCKEEIERKGQGKIKNSEIKQYKIRVYIEII